MDITLTHAFFLNGKHVKKPLCKVATELLTTPYCHLLLLAAVTCVGDGSGRSDIGVCRDDRVLW